VRIAVLLVVASILVAGGIDAGSVVLTRLTVPDHVREAGQAAAQTIENDPVNQRTAQLALAAAREEARTHGMKIRAKSFTIYKDGHITLTGVQTAPSLILERIPALQHFTKVRATDSVTALPYS
jgi:hypothetical protein